MDLMNRLLFLICSGTVLSVAACGAADGDDLSTICPTCVTAPEAAPADDGKPTGIYKGVVYSATVSGSIWAMIASDGKSGTCELTIDGEKYTGSFNSVVTASPAARALEAENVTYTYVGNYFTLTLVLDPEGVVVSSSVAVSDVEAGVSITKETSTVLVECFEGMWAQDGEDGTDIGPWNMVVYGTMMLGGAASPVMPDGWGVVTGTLDGLDILVDNPPGSGRSASGTMSEDHATCSGVWSWPGASGTWAGQRTR